MKINFLFIGLLLFFSCKNVQVGKQDNNTYIRSINNTKHSFTNVSLFSMSFKKLKPGDTTSYKILDYNPLVDDPLIYCTSNGVNFARYLKIPQKDVKKLSYIIDSVQNKIMYVTSHIEK